MEFLLRLIQCILKLISMVIHPLLNIVLPRKGPSTIPPIRNQLVTLPLVEVIKLMRQRKVNKQFKFKFKYGLRIVYIRSVKQNIHYKCEWLKYILVCTAVVDYIIFLISLLSNVFHNPYSNSQIIIFSHRFYSFFIKL